MSKRHDKVTRIGTCTTYRVEFLQVNGEKFRVTRKTWDQNVTEESLAESLGKKLRDSNMLLVSVEILEQDGPHLYGMDRDDFFFNADILD